MQGLLIGGTVSLTVLIVVGLILLLTAVFIVPQQSVYIIERFGTFVRVATPGLRFKIPFLDRIAGRLSLRVATIAEPVISISKDKTGVSLDLAIQYEVIEETGRKAGVYNAYYRLSNRDQQLKQALYDVIRSVVPEHDFDDLYLKKDEIAKAVGDRLGPKFKEYGFRIVDTNIIGVTPTDPRVMSAMADINVATRQEAIKIAEGRAEFAEKEWTGKALAVMRKQIAQGFSDAVKEIGGEDMDKGQMLQIMAGVLAIQYMSMAEAIGNGPNSKTIFLSSGATAAGDLVAQFRTAMLEAGANITAPAPRVNGDGRTART